MKEKQALAERYTDLLIDWQNPALTQVVHELDKTYSAPCSPASLTWKNLQVKQAQIKMEEQRPLPRTLFHPTSRSAPRIGVVLAILLVMLLAVGTVYAQMSGLIEMALNIDPGTQQLEKTDQFVTTNTSQILQGFTVTLQKVYADDNRIIIGYSITTPKDHTYQVFANGKLYVDQAKNPSIALTEVDGVGVGQFSAYSTAYVSNFDAPSIQGNPDTIHLRFVVTSIQGSIADDIVNKLHHAQNYVPFHLPSVLIKGHLQFAITVPLHKSVIVHVGQQQSGVTLDHVAISQSETLVYLQGVSYDQFNIAKLSVTNASGTKEYQWQNTDGGESSLGGTIITFPYALANTPGNWTLTLTPGTPVQKTGNTLVFHFTVPLQ
jgi:Domain of unknown function (DUF4179)